MRATIFLAASLVSAPWVYAQSNDASSTSGFKQMDKNADGTISVAEAAADKEIAKRFKAFDANKDGKLQENEFLEAANDNSKRVLADTAITAKVKGELLLGKDIPSTAISVETYEGQVQLAGFVDKKEQVAAAGKIAAGVAGVKKVHNGLKVK